MEQFMELPTSECIHNVDVYTFFFHEAINEHIYFGPFVFFHTKNMNSFCLLFLP